MNDEPTSTRLSFGQKYKIAEKIKDMIEPDGEDGYFRYKGGRFESQIARDLTEAFGFDVSASALADIRKSTFGLLRAPRPAGSSVSGVSKEDFDALRAVVAGQAVKLENLRKVVEHYDAAQHRRRSDATAKLREFTGKLREDERVVKTKMRGAGFTDEEIATALYLSGAIIRHNGAGSTIELPVPR